MTRLSPLTRPFFIQLDADTTQTTDVSPLHLSYRHARHVFSYRHASQLDAYRLSPLTRLIFIQLDADTSLTTDVPPLHLSYRH
eukprot:gene20269-1060_t